ncbi:MAG TPA: amidohydrolase family protein [Bordetella sp.]|nr:amidohydrolase family protein [Bordetella sp.]
MMDASRGPVDCHTHAWTADLPMAAIRHYTPDGERTAAALLADMARHGIAAAVVVQPSFLDDDNLYLADTLRLAPDRLRGVAAFPRVPAAARVRELSDAGVRGARLNLFGDMALPDPRAAAWRDALDAMRKAGWHLVIAGSGAVLADALARLSDLDLPLVIDHYGMPSTPAVQDCPGIRALAAARDKTACWVKLSAPYRLLRGLQADGGAQVVRELNQLGYAGRYLWGSDAPFTRFEHEQSYARVLDAYVGLLDAGLVDADSLRRNAEYLYFDITGTAPGA